MKLFKLSVLGIALVAVMLGMFSVTMTRPLNRDEHAYITAGVLAQNNIIYKDFTYPQMPYPPAFHSALFKLTNTSYYLLWGRISAFIFMTLSALLIFLISYKTSNNAFVAIGFLLLFVFNESILLIMGNAWNHVIPLPLVLVAFYLSAFCIPGKRISTVCYLIAGICLGFAVGARFIYIAAIPPFFVTFAFLPNHLTFRHRVIRVMLPISIGLAIGLLPIVYFLMRSGFDVFLFNNIDFHLISAPWRRSAGIAEAVTITSIARQAWYALAHPSNISLSLLVYYLFFQFISEAGDKIVRLKKVIRVETLLSVLIALFSLAVIFGLPAFWPVYFAMPIPFVIVFISCCCNIISSSERQTARALLIYAVIITCIFGGVLFLKESRNLFNINKWTGISVHNTANKILSHIGTVKKGDKMATLAPLYAVEAGLPIYKELATGPFVYRVGDFIPDDKRRAYVVTSPKSVIDLFEKDPPKAIFVGFEGSLESPFIVYAQSHKYDKFEKDLDGGILYVRKDK